LARKVIVETEVKLDYCEEEVFVKEVKDKLRDSDVI